MIAGGAVEPRPRRMLPVGTGSTVAIALLGGLLMCPSALSADGRMVLFCFGSAVILWATTRIEPAFIALAAVAVMVLAGAVRQQAMLGILSSDIIWLIIGAFVIGAAFEASGLAARATLAMAQRAQTTGQLFWWVSAALVPLAFLIPSTSGRAAVALPMLRLFFDGDCERRAHRALAILIPTVILVSATAALTGASSHLLAEDLLNEAAGTRFGYARWAFWGLPFALVACWLSCWVVLRLFLTREERAMPLHRSSTARTSISTAEWKTMVVAVATLLLWTTAALHGLTIATVAVLAALVLLAPRLGVLGWKQGMKAVSWSLVVFVGAALVMGQSLITSGAASWLIGHAFAMTDLDEGRRLPLVLLVGAIAAITITSHIYITSHVARTAALAPPFLQLADTAELNPMGVLFLATVGMNYCLTFPVSSKALLMFQDAGGETFRSKDLIRLSMTLMPLHLALMIAFYFLFWRWMGLRLT